MAKATYGETTKLKFIDISEHQGDINIVNVVNQNNLDAVMIRSSWGGFELDKKFTRNADICKANNIDYGFYHFAYPNYNTDAITEAKPFVNAVKKYYKAGMPLVLDIEGDGLTNLKVDVNKWIKDFRTYVKNELGADVIVYSYMSAINQYGFENQGYKIWFAYYGVDDGKYHGYVECNNQLARQYTQNGTLKGYSGKLDLNVAYCDCMFKKVDYTTYEHFTSNHGYKQVFNYREKDNHRNFDIYSTTDVDEAKRKNCKVKHHNSEYKYTMVALNDVDFRDAKTGVKQGTIKKGMTIDCNPGK